MCVCVCVCSMLSLRTGFDKTSIFQWSAAALKRESSFSLTGCFPKEKERSLPLLFIHSSMRTSAFMPLPANNSAKPNTISLVQDLNLSRWFHFLHHTHTHTHKYINDVTVTSIDWNPFYSLHWIKVMKKKAKRSRKEKEKENT